MATLPFFVLGLPGAGLTNTATLGEWRPAVQQYQAAVRSYAGVVAHPDAYGPQAAVAIDGAETDLRAALQRLAFEPDEIERYLNRPGKRLRRGYR